MDKARARLINKFPFYACLLQNCEFRWDDRVKTAGVRVTTKGTVELAVSRKFWDSLSENHRVGLLHHEMDHLLRDHLRRGKDLIEKRIANIAMDAAINQYIPADYLPAGGILPEMFNLPKDKEFEAYYIELMKQAQQNQKGGGKGKGNGKGKGGGGENDQSESEKTPGDIETADSLDNHDWQEDGAVIDKENGSADGEKGENEAEGSGVLSEEMRKLAVDSLINKAVDEARSKAPGSIPLHVEVLIRERMKPPVVDWKRELRRFIGRKLSLHIESTRTRLNRRLFFKSPGHRKNYMPQILILNDISGSVGNDYYVRFFAEIKSILKNYDDKVEIGFFDNEMCEQVLKLDDITEIPTRPGCGGTDFNAPINYALKKKPDLLIILTDGEAPAPRITPRFPVIWAIAGNEDCKGLPGIKIYIDGDKTGKKAA